MDTKYEVAAYKHNFHCAPESCCAYINLWLKWCQCNKYIIKVTVWYTSSIPCYCSSSHSFVIVWTLIADVQVFIRGILHHIQHLYQVSTFTFSFHLYKQQRSMVHGWHNSSRWWLLIQYICAHQGGLGAQPSRGSECSAPTRSMGTTRTTAGKDECEICLFIAFLSLFVSFLFILCASL